MMTLAATLFALDIIFGSAAVLYFGRAALMALNESQTNGGMLQ